MARSAIAVHALALAAACAAAAASRSTSGGHDTNTRPWLDSSLPIPSRVALILANMTLEEKICQLNHIFPPQMTYTSLPAPYITAGVGALTIESTPPPNATHCDMECRIANLRAFQTAMLSNTRLGIPVSFVIETSHSGAAGGTIFPMGSALGTSWNASLVKAVFAAIALEARSWGGDMGLSPEINVVTDPRFGRSEENFGGDPLHVATLTTAAVTGLQGGTTSPLEYLPSFTTAISGQAKHAIAYGFGGMDGVAADMSDKTLHDVYLKPWRAYIEAGGRAMMLSHNELNGVQMHANGEIMTDLFRGLYNFTGLFAADDGNVDALTNARVAANLTMAAALALPAGMDQQFSGSAYTTDVLVPAVQSGAVSVADIDRATGNVLAAKFSSGLFDGALPDPAQRPNIYSPAHIALAREATQQSAVLLSNVNGILPLSLPSGNSAAAPRAGALSGVSRVAVIGPNSGCPAPGNPSPPPPGQCNLTPNTDCDGDDIDQITGVKDAATCCQMCLKNASCIVAVWASDAQQCLIKSGCALPTPLANRVLIDVGRLPPLPPSDPSPWTCQAQRAMLGGYSNLENSFDQLNDNHAHIVTVLEAAVAAANASANAFEVTWSQGCDVQALNTSGIAAAVDAAAAADVAIVVLGDSAEAIGYDASVSSGEGADRPSLDLPGVQLMLLSALLETKTPIIVILAHGRPVTFGSDYGGSLVSTFTANGQAPLNERAAAVISAWRPGCEAGHALWDILTGVVSPSGRLAQAWPVSAGAVHMGGTTPWFRKWCSEECGGWTLGAPFAPMYPFGFGLDYLQVTFGVSTAAVNPATQTVDITIVLSNAASRGGSFVVQVYFSQALSKYTPYQRLLGAFTKVLVPGAGQAQATVSVQWRDMANYDPDSADMILEAGAYTFFICRSSAGSDCPAANTHTVDIPEALAWVGGTVPRRPGKKGGKAAAPRRMA